MRRKLLKVSDLVAREGVEPRRQPFQSVAILHIQQLAGYGRLRKSFQPRASQTYCGLRCGLGLPCTIAPISDATQPRISKSA
jgi:hypothetical protein